MKSSSDNFIDSFVNLFRKFKIFKPLISIYDKYKEAILYLVFGALTTLINILAYTLLTKVLKIDYMVSNVIAWIVSVIFAYITNKMYVFESNKKELNTVLKEIFNFFFARLVSLGLDMLVMYIGCSLFTLNDIIVKILSNILVIIVNYFWSKYIIFKKK